MSGWGAEEWVLATVITVVWFVWRVLRWVVGTLRKTGDEVLFAYLVRPVIDRVLGR